VAGVLAITTEEEDVVIFKKSKDDKCCLAITHWPFGNCIVSLATSIMGGALGGVNGDSGLVDNLRRLRICLNIISLDDETDNRVALDGICLGW
jgi:hypothetical protein